jgi:hypothetical protein
VNEVEKPGIGAPGKDDLFLNFLDWSFSFVMTQMCISISQSVVMILSFIIRDGKNRVTSQQSGAKLEITNPTKE